MIGNRFIVCGRNEGLAIYVDMWWYSVVVSPGRHAARRKGVL